VVFAATAKNEMFTEDLWICDSGACGHYCNSSKVCSILKKSTMTATKVGSLKCRKIQVDGSGLEITINEVKYVLEL
jgi:hypothetical protein